MDTAWFISEYSESLQSQKQKIIHFILSLFVALIAKISFKYIINYLFCLKQIGENKRQFLKFCGFSV